MKSNMIRGCPIATALESVGDAWSMLILRDAHEGLTRFDQFRKSLGIAPTMLTKRLAALTADGLLEKRLYCEHPPREEYILTAAGQDFLPILMLIGAWGKRNCSGELKHYIDDETGLRVQPVAIDAVTGTRLGSRKVRKSKIALGSETK